MIATVHLAVVRVFAQSKPPESGGSNPAVVIIGVLLVTAIAVFVVARRHRSKS